MNKKSLSERDICTKFITPALEKACWDTHLQILEEVSFTDGKIYVKGKLTARGTRKRADYILYYKPNIPIAIIEAKDNNHSVRAGIQQGLDYARILDIPCVFSSNGDGFLFHDRTATDGNIETEIDINDFPTPQQLWEKYKNYKGIATFIHNDGKVDSKYIREVENPQYSKGQKPKIDKDYIKHTVIVLRGLAALSTKLVLQNTYKQNVSDKRVSKMAKTLDEYVNNYTQHHLQEIGGSVVK
jgi:type I site-specific restriction endonuclease